MNSYYLVKDPLFLNDQFRTNINYLSNNWRSVGRPIYVVPITSWLYGMTLNFVSIVDADVRVSRQEERDEISPVREN